LAIKGFLKFICQLLRSSHNVISYHD